MKFNHLKKHYIYLAAAAIDLVVFMTVNADKSPAPLIGLVLVCNAILFFGLFSWLLALVRPSVISRPRQLLLVTALTVVMGLMMVLQATGQLTLRDFIGVTAIFMVGWLYVSRFSLKRTP